jgi:hypothetical protein
MRDSEREIERPFDPHLQCKQHLITFYLSGKVWGYGLHRNKGPIEMKPYLACFILGLFGVNSQTTKDKICWINILNPPITQKIQSMSLQTNKGALGDMLWLGALNSLQRAPSLM